MSFEIYLGDCIETMRDWPDNSVDAVVTDPPYELGFMAKKWDGTGIAYSVELWREVLRILKPGGHMLAFGGTRTYHRMTFAIEDADFEIRDSLHWFYGTGFPKSKNPDEGLPLEQQRGFGTALKPGHEPIVLARKSLGGTVAATIEQWGTGSLNIDACRIVGVKESPGSTPPSSVGGHRGSMAGKMDRVAFDASQGRWPANVLLDENAAAELDAQSGTLAPGNHPAARRGIGFTENGGGSNAGTRAAARGTESGGASRFFYVAKPARKERDAGCELLPLKSAAETVDREEDSAGLNSPRAGAGRTSGARNIHPTVKPVALLQYLCRLITPPGGLVLDPFMGSGTTGIAAMKEGFDFIGIEKELEYLTIANARINHHQGVTEK